MARRSRSRAVLSTPSYASSVYSFFQTPSHREILVTGGVRRLWLELATEGLNALGELYAENHLGQMVMDVEAAPVPLGAIRLQLRDRSGIGGSDATFSGPLRRPPDCRLGRK